MYKRWTQIIYFDQICSNTHSYSVGYWIIHYIFTFSFFIYCSWQNTSWLSFRISIQFLSDTVKLLKKQPPFQEFEKKIAFCRSFTVLRKVHDKAHVLMLPGRLISRKSSGNYNSFSRCYKKDMTKHKFMVKFHGQNMKKTQVEFSHVRSDLHSLKILLGFF